ncbi:hypothetical protein [Streptomyces sp. NA04227]|uniref:hypothetical protein n=1 Tax=Streptomyces sp. NA04227 TaxID=2742136 RepID=UPI0020CA57B4|nr:hypothetical protein [Streptomyces sp. NA04227]
MRVRGRGTHRLRALLRRRRRLAAAGLAVTAAALVATGGPPRGEAQAQVRPDPSVRGSGAPLPGHPQRTARPDRTAAQVRVLVRIADAESVRLLRRGDRVDVIATDEDGAPRVVAAGARVDRVASADQAAATDLTGDSASDGALVVLSVPRQTGPKLAAAGGRSRLAVTLW